MKDKLIHLTIENRNPFGVYLRSFAEGYSISAKYYNRWGLEVTPNKVETSGFDDFVTIGSNEYRKIELYFDHYKNVEYVQYMFSDSGVMNGTEVHVVLHSNIISVR